MSQQITTDKIAMHSFGLVGRRHFVVSINPSSFLVEIISGSLLVKINSGIAVVGGYYVEETSTSTLLMPANSTRYIYVQVITDGSNRALYAQYLVSPNSNLEDEKTMLLAQVNSGSSAITSVIDRRQFNVFNVSVHVINVSSSTTQAFPGAKAMYAIFQAIGGGGGGARLDSASSGTVVFGGAGGSFIRGEDLILNAVQIEIVIGAGGAGTNVNGSGSAGGDTIIRFKNANNAVIKEYVAFGGAGGYSSSGTNAANSKPMFMWYDIYDFNNNTGDNFCWTLSENTDSFITAYSRRLSKSGTTFFGGGFTTWYGAGTGLSFIFGGGSVFQPSAIIVGGSGATSGGFGGNYPGGGGGASQTSSGTGAGGYAEVYLLVFY